MAGRIIPKIVTDGLVLYLDAANPKSFVNGNTVWNDLSNTNNNCVLTNGPIYNSSNGGNILFDGVDDRIYSFNNQFPISSSKTIDVWFRTTSTNRQGLCGTRDGQNGWVFTINRTSSGRLTYFHTASGVAEFDAGITINVWINAVVSHDSNTGIAKLYVNGNTVGSTNVGAITSTTLKGVVGDEDGVSPSTPFKGNISITKIYNKVLSDTEVLQNYNATKKRFGL